MIRGTEDYAAPGSNEYVQLPNNYDHVYTNGNGEYLLTNDSLYNPNTDAAINNRTWETHERQAVSVPRQSRPRTSLRASSVVRP